MRFLLLLTISLVELATTVGKWLFIVSAPVLLIVAGSYYRARKSSFEPLVGLTLVAGVFAGTHRLSVSMERFQHHEAGHARKVVEISLRPVCNELRHWVLNLEAENRQNAIAQEMRRRIIRHRAGLWKQANPWGGYSPFE